MGDDERIASILGDWQERRDRGEDVAPEDVVRAHPDLAGPLRAKFEALAGLDETTAATDASPARARLRPLPLDRYADFRPAGEGGMGIVYWAIDTDLNREVAFKVIRPGAGEAEAGTPEAPVDLTAPAHDTPASQAFETLKQRFLQEAWVTGGLSHPGIVPVYELGATPEGVPYYTMRFIKGERTLTDAIETAKTRDVEERLKLLEPFLKVCDTLSYAHAKGVIHRDLKPDNIALGEFGEVVVIDWGLAKIKDRPDVTQEHWQDRIQEYREATDLRTVASAMGTPGYMAPEAAKGQADLMDERSDVYSLGAILFQILTGRLPFVFTTFGELVLKVLREDPPAANEVEADVPESLSDLCAACLSRELETRPADAEAVAQAVRSWQAQSAADREIAGWLLEAKTALDAAEGLNGAALLGQVDRATAVLSQVRRRQPEHARAAEYRARADALREQGIRQREQGARRRLLLQGGVAVLALVVVASVIVATWMNRQREEAEEAKQLAQQRLAETYEDQGRRELEAGRPRRALALLNAAYQEGGRGDDLRLLLGYAARTVDVLQFTLEGHEAPVVSVEYSPDGTRIATGSLDRTARLWDAKTGESIAVLTGHGDGISALAFHPEGTFLATASEDGTARLWDAKTGELRRVLEGHRGPVRSCEWSPDGTRLLTLGDDDACRIWKASEDVAPLVLERVLAGSESDDYLAHADSHPMGFDRVGGRAHFTPDGACVVTSGHGAGILFWDVETGGISRRLESMPYEVAADIGHHEKTGLRLLALGEDLRVWSEETPEEMRVLAFDEGSAQDAAWSPSADRIASVSDAYETRVWRAKDGEVAFTHANPAIPTTYYDSTHAPCFVAFSKDGKRLATSVDARTAVVWDAASGQPLARLEHPDWVWTAAFASDGRSVVTGCFDGTARVWRADVAGLTTVPRGKHSVLGPDGRRLLAREPKSAGPGSEEWLVRDLDSGATIARLEGGHKDPHSLAFSPDGSRVLAQTDDVAHVWDARTGRLVSTLGDRSAQVRSVSWSPDRTRWLARYGDGVVRLHAAEDGEVRLALGSPVDPASDVAWNPDGRSCVTTFEDGEARVYDLDAGGEVKCELKTGGIAARRARFSDDGRWIESPGPGETLRIFAAGNGRLVSALTHPMRVGVRAFSPEGDRIATACPDQKVRIWDVGTGALLQVLDHPGGIGTLRWVQKRDDKRGRLRLLTVGRIRELRLWDPETGALIRVAGEGSGDLVGAAFSPRGDHVLTAAGRNYAVVLSVWSAADATRVAPSAGKYSSHATKPLGGPDGARLGFNISHDPPALGIRDPDTWETVAQLQGDLRTVGAVALSPDGRWLATWSTTYMGMTFSLRPDVVVRIWDRETGTLLRTLEGHHGQLRAVSFDHSGRRVLTHGVDLTVRLWDAESGQELAKAGDSSGSIEDVVLSSDGSRLLTTTRGMGAAHVRDPATGRALGTLASDLWLHDTPFFSRDGSCILTQSSYLQVRTWDGRDGSPRAVLDNDVEIDSQALSPDGEWVVTVGDDGALRVWGAGTGTLERILRRPGHNAEDACFAPDGTWLLTTGDCEVVLWNTATWTPSFVRTFDDEVSHIGFSPDGRRFVTVVGETCLRLWSAADGKPLLQLESSHGFDDPRIGRDGTRLFVEGWSKTHHAIWDLAPERRSPAEMKRLVEERVPFRIRGGHLVEVALPEEKAHTDRDQLWERVDTADSIDSAAWIAADGGDVDGAAERYQKGRDLIATALTEAPTSYAFHEEWLWATENQADMWEGRDETRRKALLEEALAHAEKLRRMFPGSPEARDRLAYQHEYLAGALQEQGDAAGAIAHYRAELALRAEAPDRTSMREWQDSLEPLAELLESQGDLDGARAACLRALALAEKEATRRDSFQGFRILPPTTSAKLPERAVALFEAASPRRDQDLARAHAARAYATWRARDLGEATGAFEDALAARERAAREAPQRLDLWHEVVLDRARLVEVLLARANPTEASVHLDAAFEACVDLVAQVPENPTWQRTLGLLYDARARTLDAADDPEGAGESRSRALEILERLVADHPEMVSAWGSLGETRFGAKACQAAEEAFDAGVRLHPSPDVLSDLVERRKTCRLLVRIRDAAPPGPRLAIIQLARRGQAEVVGLKPGDVVMEVNGVPIGNREEFRREWRQVGPDQKGTLTIWRDGETKEITPKGGQIGIYLFDLPAQ